MINWNLDVIFWMVMGCGIGPMGKDPFNSSYKVEFLEKRARNYKEEGGTADREP